MRDAGHDRRAAGANRGHPDAQAMRHGDASSREIEVMQLARSVLGSLRDSHRREASSSRPGTRFRAHMNEASHFQLQGLDAAAENR